MTVADGTVTVTVDGVSETRSADSVTAITITGGNGADTFVLDGSADGVPVSFAGGAGVDTVRGPAADTTWQATGAGAGNVGDATFSGVEALVGTADNKDTFVVERGGSIQKVDGGDAGFDTMKVKGDTAVSSPKGRYAGLVVLDGSLIAYDGLEPIGYAVATIVFNGRDLGGTTEFGSKDFLRVGACPTSTGFPPLPPPPDPACPAGNIYVKNFEGPFGFFEIAELQYFDVSASTSVTINGGLGTDKVIFEGNYVDQGASLTVNAEEIKVDAGVTVDVGTGTLTFNAATNDNGISLIGITTTIPVLGATALVDISPDDGDWESGGDYDAGDVVVDPTNGLQYRALNDIDPSNTAPSADPGTGAPAGSAQLIGGVINLTAFAGSLKTALLGAHNLTGTNDTLTVASTQGFADNGTLTIAGIGTCSYTGRTANFAANTTPTFTFTGVAGCTGAPADGTVVRKDIEENGSDTGFRHAALDLEYHATVDVHGASLITATGNVTLASSIDVTATANAAGGPFKGNWVSGTNYTKGDIVLDTTDSTRYAATSDITPSTTAPNADSGLLGKWRKAEQKDSSVIAAFVLALAKTRLSGTSAIAAGNDDDVALSSNVKTSVTTAADASSTGSGASVAVVVMITNSEAYVDSKHATPVTGKSLTISADTDNAAPTSAQSSPAGANDNAATPQGTNANSPTQQATTRVNGAHVLGAILTVHTTGGFANSGVFTVEGVGGNCLYSGRTDTTFTGISGCSGSVADGAYVRGTSQQQATPAAAQANNQSKTSDGNQNLSAALAVVVLVATTQAYISAADTATHTISTPGGANKIHAGSKHATSATADGGNVKFSPGAPTLGTAAGGSLAVDTTYFYKVTAVFGAAESLPSAEASKKTSATDKTIELNWTAVAGATGYKVYRGTDERRREAADALGAVTTFTDDGSAALIGDAPPTSDPTSGYGIAVAVNVAVVTTKAFVSGKTTINAASLTVEALAPSASSYAAEATSGAGGSSVGVAGSIAVNVLVANTTADLEGAGPVTLNGDLTLTASSDMTNGAVALAKQSANGNTTGIARRSRSTSSTTRRSPESRTVPLSPASTT